MHGLRRPCWYRNRNRAAIQKPCDQLRGEECAQVDGTAEQRRQRGRLPQEAPTSRPIGLLMAPRKDQLHILRRDAAFSATLHATGAPSTKPVMSGTVGAGAQVESARMTELLPGDGSARSPAPSEPQVPAQGSRPIAISRGSDSASGPSRSVPVCVALSLSEAQARRAEAWASAAGCSVPLLMRQVAQSLRKGLVEPTAIVPLQRVEEVRSGRRCHPASVTLTLPEVLVQDLRARLDPLGVLGLGRAIGPAFRQRFSTAFDEACARAGF